MLYFIDTITDKPEWERKVHDESIIANWRKEADELDWDSEVFPGGDMSPEMFEYVSDCMSIDVRAW